MWVISKSRLREFWESPQGRGAQSQLEAWHHTVEHASWATFADIKQTYGASVDQVGDCLVFDIAGNKFRLIARVRYKSFKVFVLKVMTPQGYNKDQ